MITENNTLIFSKFHFSFGVLTPNFYLTSRSFFLNCRLLFEDFCFTHRAVFYLPILASPSPGPVPDFRLTIFISLFCWWLLNDCLILHKRRSNLPGQDNLRNDFLPWCYFFEKEDNYSYKICNYQTSTDSCVMGAFWKIDSIYDQDQDLVSRFSTSFATSQFWLHKLLSGFLPPDFYL